MPSTTSTTIRTPICPVEGCSDDDPCTDDFCDPLLGCQYVPLVEYDAVACRCDEPLPTVCLEELIPESLLKGSERACELIVEAGGDPDRARRLLLRAANVAKRLVHKAKQLRRHGLLSIDCGTALAERFAELRVLARDYARSLPRQP